MGWLDKLFGPYEDDPPDEINEGFASGLLNRHDIPWGVSDEDKDAHLLNLLGERKQERKQGEWW